MAATNGSRAVLPGHVRVAIVGSGFSGMGAAVKLTQQGIDDFIVLERDAEVGGTWWANTYPGCACDVPSHLYSYSFAPNPEWSRTYSPQPEILEYLRRCADQFGIRPKIRLGCSVERVAWDDARTHWKLETSDGPITADIVISGAGGLVEPKLPDIPGIDDFKGTMFHSARWNHDHDLTGKKVAVVGTGASTIQIVPIIQPQVGSLKVFQRTAPWVMPHRDRAINDRERRIYRAIPQVQRAVRNGVYWLRELIVIPMMHPWLIGRIQRLSLKHINTQIADPELRAKVTPNYTIGCKRILQSNDYYPALQAGNAELVTDRITEIRANSIVTADGAEHEVDTIILGTGFHVTDFPFAHNVVGKQGETLAQQWEEGGAAAFRGTTIKGFPNLFLLLGPNTGLGHTSILVMTEAQIGYTMDAIRLMDQHDVATVEVRPEVQDAYNRDIQERLQGTVWNTGGCASWYLDEHGKNSVIWPGATWRYRRDMRHFDFVNYSLKARQRSSSKGHGNGAVVESKLASS